MVSIPELWDGNAIYFLPPHGEQAIKVHYIAIVHYDLGSEF